jgi:hypothetical protein
LRPVDNQAYVLLDEDDLISTNEAMSSRPEGYYLYLREDGQLELHQGSPGHSEALLWTSPNPAGSTKGDYFAKVRGDGNFQIRQGTVKNRGDFVWKSLAMGPRDVDYCLAYTPGKQMLAVHKGMPDERDNRSNSILWNEILRP